MSVPIFIVVIERAEKFYSAYTPNIAGLSAKAVTREEVERLIIEQMKQYVDNLSSQHTDSQRRLELTTAPIAEKINCRYKYSDGWRTTCEVRAQKEGLCFQHWKLLFGHVVSSRQRFKKCVLCGEEDPLKLESWAEHCSYKTDHDEWAETLTEKRREDAIRRKG
jgi:predicted RNase H-like HicB family nuclease